MASIREQIIDHVYDLHQGVTGAARVDRARQSAYGRVEAPAVLIAEPATDDPSEPQVSTNHVEWLISLEVAVYVVAPVPSTAADPILCQSWSMMMADRTLGGLAQSVTPGQVKWLAVDTGEGNAGWVIQPWLIRYRTGVLTIEAHND